MLYDLTRPLLSTPAQGSTLTLELHAGTHLHAPLHAIPNGLSVDQLDLALLVGPCYVALLNEAQITPEALEAAQIPVGIERLLLRTHNSTRWARNDGRAPTTFVELTPLAADWIVQRGVRLLGVDAPVVASEAQQASAYILFGAEVAVAAGVALEAVRGGMYTLYCLPLPLIGTAAAPCRILLSDEMGIRPS